MITNIPTADEFRANGIAYLNLAWDSVVALSKAVSPNEDLSGYEGPESDNPETLDKYWAQAQHPLSVAVALTQQGTEFLLKGKIAEVSPFLLLSGEDKWNGSDKSFADFKTVDAQELVKLHNTVCNTKLSNEFNQCFEELRKIRNTVMHSVNRSHQFTVTGCILSILQVSHALLGERNWQSIRRKYNHEKINLWAERGFDEYEMVDFAKETIHVIDELLTLAQVRRYYPFGHGRRYLCPGCRHRDIQFEARIAQLFPNKPSSTNIFCMACGENYTVLRSDCPDSTCLGNVIDPEWDDRCLTCGLCAYETQSATGKTKISDFSVWGDPR